MPTFLLGVASLLSFGCATGKYDSPAHSGGVLSAGGDVTSAGDTGGLEVQPVAAAAPLADARKSEMAFPTGERKTSALLLEKEMPREVILDSPFEYRIRVQNLTDGALEDVRVTDSIPANLQIEGTEPVGEVAGDQAVWNLGKLAPRASKTLIVHGVATGVGTLSTCATVEYRSALCAQATVVSPTLVVELSAPEEGLSCDEFDLTVTVTNSGTGDARDVKVIDELPDGLTTPSGQRRVVMDFGTLASAQSKEKTIKVQASRAGTFEHVVTAEARGGLTATGEPVTTLLREPILDLAMTAVENSLAGRPVETAIVVANTGNGISESTMVRVKLPAGVEVEGTPEGASKSGDGILWELGTLAPGEKRDLSLRYLASKSGSFVTEAKASGRCAQEVTATARTEIRGLPALLLEVVDESDLILVGDNVTYEIRVENQGSASDTDIRVECLVEEGIQIVGTGETYSAEVTDRKVVFDTIPELKPGGKVVMTVTVRSSRELDSRFTVNLTSAQKTRPVTEMEATNFYK